jgi:RecB family exonuclease
MKTLHIYPTSRAIRLVRQSYQEQNQLLPTLMRIDEFERRAIILPQLRVVDPLQRRLLLREAAKFESFNNLKINRDLVRFFTKSDAIFKFFEELSWERVTFDALMEGDAYAEFVEHIEILQELLYNYKNLLLSKGLIDRVFIPDTYTLNQGFIESYDRFELYLEGYLSHFELEIIGKIAEKKSFVIHMQTSKFNRKVQERFEEMGVVLEEDFFVSFDLHTKTLLSSLKNEKKIVANVLAVEERLAQIPLLLEAVEKMVRSGIEPDKIVVILPDESFKESLHLYDGFNNFNFAMGFEYSQTEQYKRLEAIYTYWKEFSTDAYARLKRYQIVVEDLAKIEISKRVDVVAFFEMMMPFDLDLKRKIVEERWLYFQKIFAGERMAITSWLFLWLRQLSELSLDDVRGGKITVMGALETRGGAFDGVVIVDFNDGIVPAIPAKDAFLNSSLRKFANLPTKNDREALQKQIYKRLLEQSKEATIIYSLSNNKMPAGYLYELGLKEGKRSSVDMRLLYDQKSQIVPQQDPIIEQFDATKITWSPTRLKSFLSCRRKYYYQYVAKLKPKEDEEINEGAFLHTLLEHLFKDRDHFDEVEQIRDQVHRLMDYLLEDQTPKTNYMKLLWRAKLEKFLFAQIDHFKAGWRVMERERHIVGKIQGIPFKGVVDRIDQNDTHTMVLDYKSGSIAEANRTKNLEKLTDFQMSIYAKLLEASHTNLSLAFVEILNGGEITPITLLEEKQALLYEVIEELKSLNRVVCQRCEEVSLCQYCPYRLLCERGEYL